MSKLKELIMGNNFPNQLREASPEMLDTYAPMLNTLKMSIPSGKPRHKDNFEHSIRVLENAIAREKGKPDLILRTAALYHDIGKPLTRKFEGSIVSFQNHEHAGAKLIRQHFRDFGYSPKEVKEIALLVSLHMRSHAFTKNDWTDSAVRRLLTETKTPETLNRLIILFYSDATTKHDSKLARLHSSVDRLVEALNLVKKKDERAKLRPSINGNEIMELFGLTPGRELGEIMKQLNKDENIRLSKEEAISFIEEKFFPRK